MNSTCVDELKFIKKNWLIWKQLASDDIKMRYRRSRIGPLWLTISMAVTIYSMGFLYAHLFRVDLNDYFPFLASGLITWTFISLLIQESSRSLIDSANYIKNQESYLLTFVMRVVIRNVIIFFHNFLAFIPIMLIFKVKLGLHFLLLFPGLFIIGVNALFWGGVMAIIGSKYRDFTQIINSATQVIFFVTPIMWSPKLLPAKYHWIVDLNPVIHYVELIRKPLLNQFIDFYSCMVILFVSLLGFFLFSWCINKFKYRVVFWI